ncbi:3'-5' exonuclease domain-containing protein 2 [Algoriphagus halophytocola]|uniref:3'-5' exonuclease domain-containing protein 2 n=1 Tax=Algoriphagus halophytocola TaxID=2991499 RepID=A0ABY6MKI9_9BACT|nr:MULTISPECIES: 3'-5' exonuclease [unclassified Algoriphagus]UZD24293.1 3'-5' exonuclease domain-containing protein 2 [Algoriphagus sp. TR-M5]WBL41662.1 3'-5' exonuclease domain-containing protein 2 [Algoriphagus sp. TR-M9]
MIKLKITKEEVNELPLGKFEGEMFLIDKVEDVEEVAEFLVQQRTLGFDTETKPAFRKGVINQVALLQLSTPTQAFLFRLNEIGFPDAIRNILEKESIVKVGAAVHDDIKGLAKLTDSFYANSFFDLNDELKKVGFENIGVRNLCAMVLGIRISKSEQVSNWEADTLTIKQQRYAATDAWSCLEIFHKLKAEGYLDELFKQ